jgi:hypothetical protein
MIGHRKCLRMFPIGADRSAERSERRLAVLSLSAAFVRRPISPSSSPLARRNPHAHGLNIKAPGSDPSRGPGLEFPESRIFGTHSIRDKPIAPGSPWQNGFAERLIGSIRRECVDHVVVLGEAHLCRILTKYRAYYNELRTHRSLDKDAPIHRAVQHVGGIVSAPVLGGLHHHYCRI